ncbi:hypothetical protein J3F84DRAFT_110503 [Trichoderma pleuroticola]
MGSLPTSSTVACLSMSLMRAVSCFSPDHTAGRACTSMCVHSCKGKRDAGCCDAIATKKNTDQANVSALSNSCCIY